MTFDEAAAALAGAGIESPRAEARILLAHVLGVPRDAALNPPPLTGVQQREFERLVARRAAREPSAYITGVKEFWSLELAVGPGVLVPRPETETLIEQALALYPHRPALRIADLGTGSGAILAAALAEFPDAAATGIDSSEAALAYARRNLGSRAGLIADDWNSLQGPFDLIFSNPPYIPTADLAGLEPELAHEPVAALDGGADGLGAYRALAKVLPRLLAQGGHALLEIGHGQAPAMELLFPGLNLVKIVPDLADTPRCVVLVAPG